MASPFFWGGSIRRGLEGSDDRARPVRMVAVYVGILQGPQSTRMCWL